MNLNARHCFSTRLDGILDPTEENRKELAECTERIKQAEVHLSTVEDEHAELQEIIKALKKRNPVLEDKVVDMETRARLNNLRLVNLPEGAQTPDPCSFLEGWLLEVLNLANLWCLIVMERAHRVRLRRDNETPRRTLIMRFLNYKEKMEVLKAAKAEKETLYKNQQVHFYDDLATEVCK